MFASRARAEERSPGFKGKAVPPASKPAGPAPFDPLYLPLDLSYPGLSKVCEKPPIFVCEDFLSAAECEQLIKVSGPLLQRSKTHAAAGSEATNGRTSLTCHLAKKTAPCPAILAKIQKLTSKPFGHMELPQVARYTDSQRYVEHYDGVDPHTEAGRAFCANGGQRVATVLMCAARLAPPPRRTGAHDRPHRPAHVSSPPAGTSTTWRRAARPTSGAPTSRCGRRRGGR